MKENTGKKIRLNFFFGIFGQVVTLIIGILIPRLFIVSFGSEVNGFINSMNQVFKQGVKFAEDAIFHLNCVRHSDKIVLSTGIVYVYNKLEFESATTKYYLEITDWMAELAKTRFDVLSGKNLDKNLFENYISYNAFEELFFIVIYCVQKCDNPNITKEMCKHYFENVSQYFSNNTEAKEKQKIYEYCKDNDYDGLYLHINKALVANNAPTFLTRLKRILGELYLKFKIVRYRYF